MLPNSLILRLDRVLSFLAIDIDYDTTVAPSLVTERERL